MSGIAGIIHFDGAPVEPGQVEKMTSAMAYRGPDGIGHWVKGAVALGQCMLRTTPESLEETQPLANEDASLVLVLDGRVDNFDALRRELLARRAVLRDRSDAELVLRAYETWGEACPDRIVGEFAFVLWDGRRRQLFGARDPAGTRHFYYHAGDRWFAFASEIKGLLALGLIAPRLNQPRFIETLVNEFDRENEVGTCYAGIDRLPAGHAMRVLERGMASWRYWDPADLPESRFASMDECAEAYLEQLRLAVSCRLRAIGPVGAALSGGLDSSSIVGLVTREFQASVALPLMTFSLVREDRERCPEWQSVRRLEKDGSLDATYIVPSIAAEIWQRYLGRIAGFDEPFALRNGYTDFLVCEAAHARGCRVLLDGMAGDLLFYWFDESLAFDRATIFKFPLVFRAAVRHDMLPGLVRGFLLGALAAALPRLRDLYRKTRKPYLPQDARLLHREIALRLVQTRRPNRTRSPSDQVEHARLFTSGLLSFAHEGLGQIALAQGIEPRSPFSDRRMIEFAIRLPRTAKLCAGWYKVLMRKAMANVLPESVRWRRDVTMHPGNEFRNRFISEISRGAPHIWNSGLIERRMASWIDPARLREEWQRYELTGESGTGIVLLALAESAQWLRSRFAADF